MTITIGNNDPRISYSVSEGVTQTSFTVPFEFFDNADLNVYVDAVLKTITTHYSVTGGSGSGGVVAISVTGASGGSTVIITRSISQQRTTDFPTSGPFNISSLNTELDRFTAIAADLQDSADRSLKLVDYDSEVDTQMPLLASRKGTVLGFNATTGVPEAGPNIAAVQSLSDITADINALADIEDGTVATDAISGLAAIKTNVTTVAGISANVTSVAGNTSNINTVAADGSDIGTVAGAISNVNTVAAAAANVTIVAGISSDVTTVANDATDIGNVSASIANVNLVASSLNSGALTATNDYGSVANATVTTTDYGSV
tara:strand:- start:1119 stop:2069 length:951 start_codon:yes stop_codon:yes gene_type:complete